VAKSKYKESLGFFADVTINRSYGSTCIAPEDLVRDVKILNPAFRGFQQQAFLLQCER